MVFIFRVQHIGSSWAWRCGGLFATMMLGVPSMRAERKIRAAGMDLCFLPNSWSLYTLSCRVYGRQSRLRSISRVSIRVSTGLNVVFLVVCWWMEWVNEGWRCGRMKKHGKNNFQNGRVYKCERDAVVDIPSWENSEIRWYKKDRQIRSRW